MKKFGLVGHPLTSQSVSKKYFEEKIQSEKLEASYDLFSLENINEIGHFIFKKKLHGLNVTMPYNKEICNFLDDIDEKAKQVGYVNTIKVLDDGRMKGYNTHHDAFVASLTNFIKNDKHKALVLGDGGISDTVQVALKELDIPCIVVSRRGAFLYEQLTPELMAEHTLIVHASPLGAHPNVVQYPLLPYEHITKDHYCYDLIYNPEETEFLRLVKEKGAKTKNGLEMFGLQADASWRIWNEETY